MSFLGASGGSSASGRIPSTPPTSITWSILSGTANGTAPQFYVTAVSGAVFAPKQLQANYSINIYKTSDNTLASGPHVTTIPAIVGSNLVAGTSYYAKIAIKDAGVNTTYAESSATGNLTAITKPANMGAITASNGIGILNTSWTAVDSGGATVTYTMNLYQSGNSGANYGQLATATTTSTSYAWTGLTGGSGWFYYVSITPSNSSGSSSAQTSSAVNVTAPGPYFPYFPFFPTFGGGCRPPCYYPSFCSGGRCLCC